MRKIISLSSSGSFKHTNTFFNRVLHRDFYKHLNVYGEKGVNVLRTYTPKDSGESADSWSYDIYYDKNTIQITWRNSKMADQVPIVILLQYGHLTKDGSFLQGTDFINPAIQPIFQEIAESIWEEVTER